MSDRGVAAGWFAGVLVDCVCLFGGVLASQVPASESWILWVLYFDRGEVEGVGVIDSLRVWQWGGVGLGVVLIGRRNLPGRGGI